MGLSNEERFSHIAWGIKRLHDKYKEQRSRALRGDTYLLELMEQLWPALLNTQKNNLFWITGSAFSDTHQKGLTLTSVLLCGQKPEKDEHEFPDYPLKTAYDMTDIGTLLNDDRLRQLFDIQGEAEHLTYALRRYSDDFQSSFAQLNSLISKIIGEVFTLFTAEPNVIKAYLIHQIAKRILTTCSDGGPVHDVWAHQHIHHDIRVQDELETSTLLEMWTSFQNKWPSQEECLIASLTLAGRRFHYIHNHKALLAKVTAYNLRCAKKNRIDIVKVEAALAQCLALRKQYEEWEARGQTYCTLTDQSGKLPSFERAQPKKRDT